MRRTISIRLQPTSEQIELLYELQQEFVKACHQIAPVSQSEKCWNRVSLHHLTYYDVRKQTSLGSQMVCNAIHAVCSAYKTWKQNNPKQEVPLIQFRQHSSVHYDKRTYRLLENYLSLYTLKGRIQVPIQLGSFQKDYLEKGVPKEAELICKKRHWFFNLVLDIESPAPSTQPPQVLGVDLGENNLASLDTGHIFGGGQLRQDRDQFLALRSRLQSNGSKSSKQLLKKVSGKEARHVKQVNHTISKAIVQEALENQCTHIALEKLTNIRKRIKGGKRLNSRLHRWSWAQLQNFVQYKAEAVGIGVIYVNPAYTSRTCSTCGEIGSRVSHRFSCKKCESDSHADVNASINLKTLAMRTLFATGNVNCPNVAPA